MCHTAITGFLLIKKIEKKRQYHVQEVFNITFQIVIHRLSDINFYTNHQRSQQLPTGCGLNTPRNKQKNTVSSI